MNRNGKLNAARVRTKAHNMMASKPATKKANVAGMALDVFDGTDTPQAENSKADIAQDKKEAKNAK